MPYERKEKRVQRLRFQRPTNRKQEAFIIFVVVVLVLIILAMLMTLWQMPSATSDSEPGVHTVTMAPAHSICLQPSQYLG